MRKMILGCLGVVAAVAVIQFAQAEVKAGVYEECSPCEFVSCNPCDAACDPCDAVCGSKKSLWFLGGHLEAGVYANEYGVTDVYGSDVGAPGAGLLHAGNAGDALDGGRLNFGNAARLNNVQQTNFQMHQLYINGGKRLSKRGWDVGGEIGFMYGTDARLVQSEGLEYGAGRGAWDGGDYYTALAQMYAEVGYNNLSVKAGKFLTPMGHEGVLSTDRFFYSLSNAFGMMPVTHSGVVATWDANKRLSVFGGWVNGEDKFFNTSDDNAFLGGFKFKVNKRISVAYSVLVGQDETEEFSASWRAPFNGRFSVYREDQEYFVQSFVVDVKLNKRWNYAFEWTLRNENSGAGAAYDNNLVHLAYWNKAYTGGSGINQELIYKYNKKWAFGFRAEWLHQYDVRHDYVEVQNRTFRGRDADDYEVYSFTLAANWTPVDWILVRPELRYDKYDGASPFSERQWGGPLGKSRDKQLSGGVSAVVKF